MLLELRMWVVYALGDAFPVFGRQTGPFLSGRVPCRAPLAKYVSSRQGTAAAAVVVSCYVSSLLRLGFVLWLGPASRRLLVLSVAKFCCSVRELTTAALCVSKFT